jgi:HNH endonuclease
VGNPRQEVLSLRPQLLLRNMEIEHIVPESLAEDSEKRKEVLERIGLDPGFNIQGYENLTTSCSVCNADKSNLVLADGAIAIALAKIKSKLPALQEALRNQRRARDLEGVMRMTAKSLDAGKFAPDELLRELTRSPHFSGLGLRWQSTPAEKPPGEVEEAPRRLILWSRQAMADIKHLRTTEADISFEILCSVRDREFWATKVRDGHHTYKIRAGRDLRVLFRVRPDAVLIVSVYSKREARPWGLKKRLERGG